jgi:hypothetical protein
MRHRGILIVDPMRPVRRRLSWMLASWLVFQLVGIVAPVVLAATGMAVEEAVCTCPGAEHAATCPMHHNSGTPAGSGRHADEATPKEQKNPCAMRNAQPPTDIALLALAGGAGVLPRFVAFDAVEQTFSRISLESASVSSRTELPDPLPPRA